LTEAYEIIRAKPITCATVVRLNYVAPPEPVVEDRPPSVEERKPAKGKKK
jgi:hypothetical protein